MNDIQFAAVHRTRERYRKALAAIAEESTWQATYPGVPRSVAMVVAVAQKALEPDA